MSSLRTLIATLALLAPFPPIHALTPAEVELGRVQGFTGGTTSSHAGDYLTSTFCFCAQPSPTPQAYSEANYLQFEYYNSHQNTTYILSHLCLTDQDSAATCLAPRNGDDNWVYGSDWKGRACRTFDDYEGLYGTNTFCYEADPRNRYWREWRMPGRDVISFNGQKRELDPVGSQGPVLKGQAEAEDRCEGLCGAHAGMPVLRSNELAECHVVVYEDLDDMCGGCA